MSNGRPVPTTLLSYQGRFAWLVHSNGWLPARRQPPLDAEIGRKCGDKQDDRDRPMDAEAEPRQRYQGGEDELRPRLDATICSPLDRGSTHPRTSATRCRSRSWQGSTSSWADNVMPLSGRGGACATLDLK